MTEDSLLDKINSPSDIKKMTVSELSALSDEIREEIVESVSKNGGHLASNLGVVELTLAIHSVFDLPDDKIVWDVGHQSYTHKILTGRREQFSTLRTENGLSGFPKREESLYDCFDTGHSSTSVSAAFGIACANNILSDKHYTIAVIGDGALTGGMALEALNSAGKSKQNLIVILNDNKMSISKNVGSMAKHLTRLRIQPSYLDAKSRVQSRLNRIPGIGQGLAKMISGLKSWIRINFFGHQKNMFELLGFNYYGPLDGHDIAQLQTALKAAKRSRGPVILHVCTKKGKGYEYAEKKPNAFHGISAFDIETGEPKSSSKGYSAVFGEFMCNKARMDKRLCAITAAMATGTGLEEFSKKYKNRFFDVGIAEEHAVTFACGLAAGNALPVFAVYSTFLQRSYDQLLHDAALQGLHIVVAVDRAGIVGEDGETHQGIFDVAFMNTIPGITIYAPSSFQEMESMLDTALYKTNGVVAVRYPRGGELYIPDDYKYDEDSYTTFGNKTSDTVIVTYGRTFSYACEAVRSLSEKGIDVCILKLNRIKPVDVNAVKKCLNFRNCLFFEEGIKYGGVGENFGFMLYQRGFAGRYHLQAIEDYVHQAKCASALHKLGLDSEGIENTVLKIVNME